MTKPKPIMMRMLGFVLFLCHYPADAFFICSTTSRSTALATAAYGADQPNDNAFTRLLKSSTDILTSSDLSENEIEHSYGSASQGQWICSRTAGEMQRDVLEKLVLKQVRSIL
jgi:hypothetical protein